MIGNIKASPTIYGYFALFLLALVQETNTHIPATHWVVPISRIISRSILTAIAYYCTKMHSTKSAAPSYHSIRETMISLTVDIEDKDKVCEVLQSKINQMRQEISRIERSLEEDYTSILEVR